MNPEPRALLPILVSFVMKQFIFVLTLLFIICQLTNTLGSNMGTSTKWDGNSMTQTDMMEKDTVLVLDNDDNVIGSASKKDSHVFRTDQARGVLHRAFSVFLFDESTGEILLQKRASTKITFPNVGAKLSFCSQVTVQFGIVLRT